MLSGRESGVCVCVCARDLILTSCQYFMGLFDHCSLSCAPIYCDCMELLRSWTYQAGSCHGCPTTNYCSLQPCMVCPLYLEAGVLKAGVGGGHVCREVGLGGSSGDLPQQCAVNQSDLDRTGTHLVAAPANTATAGAERRNACVTCISF